MLPLIIGFRLTTTPIDAQSTTPAETIIILSGGKTERRAILEVAGRATEIRSEVTPMKDIRGAAAIRYARELNIFFDIDRDFLTGAEEEMTERPTAMADIYALIEERTGYSYDPAEIVPDQPIFDFLINRYGDGWIYVAQEGKDPEAEERVALRMFRKLLGEEDPVYLIDAKGLYGRYFRMRFCDTGFPRYADLNLLFHAALRLTAKGVLETVKDEEPLPAGGTSNYGRRRFAVLPDIEASMVNVLCERCLKECGQTSMSLHRECARRLRQVLRRALSHVGSGSDELGGRND